MKSNQFNSYQCGWQSYFALTVHSFLVWLNRSRISNHQHKQRWNWIATIILISLSVQQANWINGNGMEFGQYLCWLAIVTIFFHTHVVWLNNILTYDSLYCVCVASCLFILFFLLLKIIVHFVHVFHVYVETIAKFDFCLKFRQVRVHTKLHVRQPSIFQINLIFLITIAFLFLSWIGFSKFIDSIDYFWICIIIVLLNSFAISICYANSVYFFQFAEIYFVLISTECSIQIVSCWSCCYIVMQIVHIRFRFGLTEYHAYPWLFKTFWLYK